MSTFIDVFKEKINTNRKVILTRLGICLVYFLFGLTMVTDVEEFVIFFDLYIKIKITIFSLIKGGSICS